MQSWEITLWGVDGTPIPLSTPHDRSCDGVGLTSVPPGLFGAGVAHEWDEATGAHLTVDVPPHQLQLDLVVVGDAATHVQNLLAAVGNGGGEVMISTMSPGLGARSKRWRLQQVSQVDWHGRSPLVAHVAHLSLLLEAGRVGWQAPDEEITVGRAGPWGDIRLPIVGDLDVWPRFTITGTHRGVRIKLRLEDTAQVLPAGGWVVDSHPEHRLVADLDGGQVFDGLVPFWPHPVRNNSGVGTVNVQVTSPGADFSLTIAYTPEASRAW